MIKKETRKHTEEEIAILQSNAACLKLKLSDLLGVAFLTIVLFTGGSWFLGKGITYLIAKFFTESDHINYIAPACCIIGTIWGIITFIKGERQRIIGYTMEQEKLNRAIQKGGVELIECDVSAIAELDEYEDEGPGYFFQVEPDVLLFLQGQYLMDSEFPASKISLTRDSSTFQLFETKASGSNLKPQRKIASDQFGGTEWLHDGMFIKGKIDELPNEIRKLKKQKDILSTITT